MAKVGIFRDGIYPSGGIETWLFNIAKRWGNTHYITIYYDNADPQQLRRLQRLVRCEEYIGIENYDGTTKGVKVIRQ